MFSHSILPAIFSHHCDGQLQFYSVLASVSSYENKVFYTNVDSAGKRWLRVVDDRTGFFSNVVELPIGSKTHEVYAFKDHVLVATVLPDALEHYLIWNGSTLADVAQNAPNVPFIIRPLLSDSGNLVWTSPLGSTQIPGAQRQLADQEKRC